MPPVLKTWMVRRPSYREPSLAWEKRDRNWQQHDKHNLYVEVFSPSSLTVHPDEKRPCRLFHLTTAPTPATKPNTPDPFLAAVAKAIAPPQVLMADQTRGEALIEFLESKSRYYGRLFLSAVQVATYELGETVDDEWELGSEALWEMDTTSGEFEEYGPYAYVREASKERVEDHNGGRKKKTAKEARGRRRRHSSSSWDDRDGKRVKR